MLGHVGKVTFEPLGGLGRVTNIPIQLLGNAKYKLNALGLNELTQLGVRLCTIALIARGLVYASTYNFVYHYFGAFNLQAFFYLPHQFEKLPKWSFPVFQNTSEVVAQIPF